MPNLSKKRKAQLEATVKEKVAGVVFEIFEKHRLKKLTIDMVARESGVSKGALYKYFKDKDNLIIYAMHKALDPYTQRGTEIADGNLPVIEKLRASAETSLICAEKMHEFLPFLIKSASVYSTVLVKEGNKKRMTNLNRLDGIMREGLRRGVLGGADARDLALYFSGITRCMYFLRCKLPAGARRPFEDDAAAIMNRFMYGVSRRGPDAEAQ